VPVLRPHDRNRELFQNAQPDRSRAEQALILTNRN
jgi:hypothetical protein